MSSTITKVLPFDGAAGHVPGHEIERFKPEWMKGHITHVLYSVWNDQARMSLTVQVHWTKWTEYEKRMWPHGGSITGLLCDDGLVIHCTSLAFRFNFDHQYTSAPIICRDTYAVVTMGSREKLLRVVGVEEWMASDRTAAATAKHLPCPWARDNKAFQERQAAARQ